MGGIGEEKKECGSVNYGRAKPLVSITQADPEEKFFRVDIRLIIYKKKAPDLTTRGFKKFTMLLLLYLFSH